MQCDVAGCDNGRVSGNMGQPLCDYHRKRLVVFKKAGFTYEKYLELQSVTDCDLCGQFLKKRNMDHDHNHCPSGQWCVKCVRGVVCSRCNGLLAGLDDKTWRRHAEKYLALYDAREDGEYR